MEDVRVHLSQDLMLPRLGRWQSIAIAHGDSMRDMRGRSHATSYSWLRLNRNYHTCIPPEKIPHEFYAHVNWHVVRVHEVSTGLRGKWGLGSETEDVAIQASRVSTVRGTSLQGRYEQTPTKSLTPPKTTKRYGAYDSTSFTPGGSTLENATR
jgi:hypothetical protein